MAALDTAAGAELDAAATDELDPITDAAGGEGGAARHLNARHFPVPERRSAD